MRLDDVALLSYPLYFIRSVLASMGWPLKKGFFGGAGVEAAAFNSAWTAAVQASMSLGAGRPSLACQLLAHVMPLKDWADGSNDEFLHRLDPISTIERSPASLPWQTLVQPEIHVIKGFMRWDDVVTQEMLDVLTGRFTAGLTFGIAHPAEVNAALNAERSLYVAGAPQAIKSGLLIPANPPFPDNQSYFEWLEQTVHSFEQHGGQLPPPPPQLLATRALRARAAA